MSTEDECPICLQPLETSLVTLPCQHTLHQQCYKAFRDYGYRRCCMCQAPFRHTMDKRPIIWRAMAVMILLQLMDMFTIITCMFFYPKIIRYLVFALISLLTMLATTYAIYLKRYGSIVRTLPR